MRFCGTERAQRELACQATIKKRHTAAKNRIDEASVQVGELIREIDEILGELGAEFRLWIAADPYIEGRELCIPSLRTSVGPEERVGRRAERPGATHDPAQAERRRVELAALDVVQAASNSVFVETLPGHDPVRRSKPLAPARSTTALTPLKTAPRMPAAAMISPQPRSRSLARGEALSGAANPQTPLKNPRSSTRPR